jgi:hypothetical protein
MLILKHLAIKKKKNLNVNYVMLNLKDLKSRNDMKKLKNILIIIIFI